MASANVTLENQLHSAQKNLLFLQQDHANTLKGLHAEIRRLQQQCTGEPQVASSLLSISFFNVLRKTSTLKNLLEDIMRTDWTAKQTIYVNNVPSVFEFVTGTSTYNLN